MKSILINSETREVKEVTLADVLKDSYTHIGNDCSMVQTGQYINQSNALMVDEEGYYKQGLCGFFYGDNFYYGNSVVWGINRENGDNQDCSVSVERVLSQVKWVEANIANSIRERIMNQPYSIISF